MIWAFKNGRREKIWELTVLEWVRGYLYSPSKSGRWLSWAPGNSGLSNTENSVHPEYPGLWKYPSWISGWDQNQFWTWLSRFSEVDSEYPSPWNFRAEFPIGVSTTSELDLDNFLGLTRNIRVGEPEYPSLGRIPETLFLYNLALGFVIWVSPKLKYLAIGLVYHWYC